MTDLKKVGFGICLLGLTVSPWVHGSNLRAGVAKVDITPAPGKYMLGSGPRWPPEPMTRCTRASWCWRLIKHGWH